MSRPELPAESEPEETSAEQFFPQEQRAVDGSTVASAVIAECRVRGLTIGAAESLTGGLVMADLISVPGASDVVRGGVVAYAADLKVSAVGVSARLLAEHGTVSQACAEAMASGAKRVLGVDVAVATTGVAGPDSSEGHPPGTVYLAVAGVGIRGEEVVTHRALTARGTRSQIRSEATRQGLSLLLATLSATPPPACSQGDGVR